VTTMVLVGLAGFGAGILAGLFGVGGGILFVPTLALGLGLTQVHAAASSLVAILPTVIVGSLAQHRYGNVDWRASLVLGLAGVAGVEGGVQVARATPEETLQTLFGVLLLLVAAQVVWRSRRLRP
jgi:uncharacterized protein